jgi:hypothetical protein
MTDIKYRGVKKSSKLDAINTIVKQREVRIGPLSVIGHSQDDPGPPPVEGVTVLGFDAAGFGTAGHSVIVKAGDLPGGLTPTCKGNIYIEGELTDCVAYRVPA